MAGFFYINLFADVEKTVQRKACKPITIGRDRSHITSKGYLNIPLFQQDVLQRLPQ